MKIKIAGLDGSLRNFGMATLMLDVVSLDITVESLDLFTTAKTTAKTVRASSDNLLRAQSIVQGLHPKLIGVSSAFLEVPSGGQSYSAVLGFGIVIGIYASLSLPVIEVSPAETKLATVGTRTASKEEMIEWAYEKYPTAPWLTRKSKGEVVPTLANEHLADAVAIAHAGIKTPAFLQTLSILRHQVAEAA